MTDSEEQESLSRINCCTIGSQEAISVCLLRQKRTAQCVVWAEWEVKGSLVTGWPNRNRAQRWCVRSDALLQAVSPAASLQQWSHISGAEGVSPKNQSSKRRLMPIKPTGLEVNLEQSPCLGGTTFHSTSSSVGLRPLPVVCLRMVGLCHSPGQTVL